MPRNKKPPPVHTDRLGNNIELGSKIAVARHNELRICNVVRLNPKMIRVAPVNSGYTDGGFLVFGHQTVVVNSDDAISFILKGNRG